MFGNLVNNKQIKDLRDKGVIEINPYNKKDQSLVHYTLHVKKVKRLQPDGNLRTIHDFSEKNFNYELEPNDYVIVEIEEVIKLNDANIVGQFVPCSTLIEQGLGLIAGKIDKKYGTTGQKFHKNQEMIHFGLKNFLNEKNTISPMLRVAHLMLFDLRGVATSKIDLSDAETMVRFKRFLRQYEDGLDPEDEEDDDK
jgi:deoxycytidine triphosphate deaminase